MYYFTKFKKALHFQHAVFNRPSRAVCAQRNIHARGNSAAQSSFRDLISAMQKQ